MRAITSKANIISFDNHHHKAVYALMSDHKNSITLHQTTQIRNGRDSFWIIRAIKAWDENHIFSNGWITLFQANMSSA